MKILISGCSFTQDKVWPKFLFAPKKYNIINLGKSAAGNEYISNSITYNVDCRPDFVYILWSGINRTDLRVPESEIFKKIANTPSNYNSAAIGNSTFFLGGHAVDPDKGWLAGYNMIKDNSWPKITCLSDWLKLPKKIKLECLQHKIQLSTSAGDNNLNAFCHQYYMTQHLDIDKKYRSEKTFQHMMNCFNMLEKYNVPYRFSFIYDIWNKNEFYAHGVAVKEKYYNFIDWTKFIDLPPYQYGIKHDLLSTDGYHLTNKGMIQWANEISDILQKDQSLKHLF